MTVTRFQGHDSHPAPLPLGEKYALRALRLTETLALIPTPRKVGSAGSFLLFTVPDGRGGGSVAVRPG